MRDAPRTRWLLVVLSLVGAAGVLLAAPSIAGACTPACTGKECGPDGCGGTCGECAAGVVCMGGICQDGPGCKATGAPGCDGCACEVCVCGNEPYCCTLGWDQACADLCIGDCGGCPKTITCGDGVCKEEDSENCASCPSDCVCPEGEVCAAGKCCEPNCLNKDCGPDGCGGKCGECNFGFGCSQEGKCTEWAKCQMVGTIGCGATIDGHTDKLGNQIGTYFCDAGDQSGPEIAYKFVAKVNDTVKFTLNTQTAGANLNLLLLEGLCAGEACVLQSYTTLSTEVKANTTYYVVVDGKNGSKGKFTLNLQCNAACVPNCGGKECGSDGCGGSCGTCAGGLTCDAGKCVTSGDGCTPHPYSGCGGCSCEQCVCAMDDFCCWIEWDGICVDECKSWCGGCQPPSKCGNKVCEGLLDENCSSCPADCTCPTSYACTNGICQPTTGGPGCSATPGVPGCQGCKCEACVCAMDPNCCIVQWDFICVKECVMKCSGCSLGPPLCGNGKCDATQGEACNTCPKDCGECPIVCGDGKCGKTELCSTCPKDCGTCTSASCCLPHSGTGCKDKTVADCVCATNPECCTKQWTAACASMADQCGSCSGDCCAQHAGPGCDDEAIEECVCGQLASCCKVQWDMTCVGLAGSKCSGCGAAGKCGDGNCETVVGENCLSCVADCPCGAGQKCNQGVCCLPDCAGRECGGDGCGGSCGSCKVGTCFGGLCETGLGCSESYTAGCGGCACEECVCKLKPECCGNGWSKSCVSTCVLMCGGCGTLKKCGDELCSPDEGEHCGNCPKDCKCADFYACNGSECVKDLCSAGLGSAGCCVGDMLYSCVDGKLQGLDCSLLDGTCGWWAGGPMPAGYFCGQPSQILPADPSGENPAVCPDVCIPACEGKACGDDGCGGVCGICAEDEKCTKGECVKVCKPDCEAKGCGPDGCGGSCGTCGVDTHCTLEGACEANQCESPGSVTCGESVTGNTEEYENLLSTYGCASWDESGPEVAYVFQSDTEDEVTLILESLDGNDYDLMVLSDACLAANCLAAGEQVTFQAEAGRTYFVVVDGYSGDAGQFGVKVFCKGSCVPQCEAKECGDDGCLGTCGVCQPPLYCVDGDCLPNNGCVETPVPGCNGCTCEACVCGTDPFCCNAEWDKLCAESCQTACGGCDDFAWCGDGLCDIMGGEDCLSCVSDCPCDENSQCQQGKCIANCIPVCDGKECGDDGCGGSCGECAGSGVCLSDGTCMCIADCKGKECGGDGCGGDCGTCPEGEGCNPAGKCQCTPDCEGKECGDNGCGGKCGACESGAVCSADFVCVALPPEALEVSDSGSGPPDSVAQELVQEDVGPGPVKKKSSGCEAVGAGGVPQWGTALLLLCAAAFLAARRTGQAGNGRRDRHE